LLQPLELFTDSAQARIVKPCANLTEIAQPSTLISAKMQCAETRSASSLPFRETDYDADFALTNLDFQPVARSLSRQVTARTPLRNNTLQRVLHRRLVQRDSIIEGGAAKTQIDSTIDLWFDAAKGDGEVDSIDLAVAA